MRSANLSGLAEMGRRQVGLTLLRAVDEATEAYPKLSSALLKNCAAWTWHIRLCDRPQGRLLTLH